MKWPHEDIQESGALYPDGLYKVKVVSQEDLEARGGQFMIVSHGRILEPKSFRGQPLDYRFVLGVTAETAEKLGIESGEDLECENEETMLKNPSMRRYKSYLRVLGVVATGDTEEEAEDAKGKVYSVQLTEKNGYQEFNRLYADGEADAGVGDGPKGALKKTRTAADEEEARPSKGKPATSKKPAAADEDDWE